MKSSTREDISLALLALRLRFSEEKITLRELLGPYNRFNQSYIQEDVFLRALQPYPTAQKIARAYSNNGIISINEIENAINQIQLQPPDPPKTPPYAISTLARHFQRLNVDYWSIFSLNDRLKVGKYDIPTFLSHLSQTGAQISQDDVNEIVNFYKVQEKVNYLAFLEDIKRTSITEQEITKSRKDIKPNEPIELNLRDIITQIKTNCQRRRVTLSRFFEGHQTPMTLYTFTRILNNANLQLSPREINFLARHCQIENGGVDPSIIIKQVDQIPTTNTFQSDSEKLISKIKHFLNERKLYLTPRFEKFDRERSGEFPVSLVNSVLNQFEFPLSEYELDLIQQKFPGSRSPFIKWRDFDNAIESEPVVTKYQEMQTIRKMNESTPKPKLNSATSSHLFRSLDDNERTQEVKIIPENIEPILSQIANYECKNSMNIFDDLREIDNLKLGFIQPYQLNSYMLTLFPRMPKNSLDNLLQYYGTKEFLYINLCKDVEEIKKKILNSSSNFSQKSNSFSNSSGFIQNTSFTPTNSVDMNDPEFKSFIKRLKAFTIQNILSPIDIFRINDNTAAGYVLIGRLQNCFSLIHFDITKNELNLLIKKFYHADNPDRFYYIPLVKILDEMKMDADEVKWILTPELAQSQIDESAHLVNCQIHTKLIARRKTIGDYFFGCPRGQLIDIKDFLNRIGKIDIVLEKFEIQVLITKYKNKIDETKIDWESFCRDVHNAKIF